MRMSIVPLSKRCLKEKATVVRMLVSEGCRPERRQIEVLEGRQRTLSANNTSILHHNDHTSHAWLNI